MKIGFIGLGQMGSGIALNLIKAGHDVTVWNRSAGRAAPLLEAGAKLAKTPREAANGELVMTMLSDDDAVAGVTFGPDGLLAAPEKPLHVSLSTISVAFSERLTKAHREAGSRFVAAPVFGRPNAAAAGKLNVAAAGAEEDLAFCAPVFAVISQKVFDVGRSPQAANLVKLAGNFLILSTIESLAEAMTLAEKGGVEKKKLLEVLTGTLFDAPVYRTYGEILIEERYRPAGFAAPLGLKDMRLVAAAAEAQRTPMPVLGVLRDHLLQAIGQEGEDIDWSSVGLSVARNAGKK
ncbi:MAG TPA: NAD(P)-dependent oxidoreductase [Devosiaceae bacterium]|nr:NAD(P)-dependent oxidoreductase [Devosiaceae bacterium]